MRVEITHGLAPKDVPAAAALFWEAFAPKLGRLLGPAPRATAYLTQVLQPDRALGAYGADGALVGLAGLKTKSGGMLGGSAADLAAAYGWAGAAWRGPLLDLMETQVPGGQLWLDGLCVAPAQRGAGIGSALIQAVLAHGAELGVSDLRLHVVDTNPRARALYLRHGFHPVFRQSVGLLRPLLGCRSMETLIRPMAPEGIVHPT